MCDDLFVSVYVFCALHVCVHVIRMDILWFSLDLERLEEEGGAGDCC